MAASGWVVKTWRRSSGPVRWARPSTSSDPGRATAVAGALACLLAWSAVVAAPAEPRGAPAGDPDATQVRHALALARGDSFHLVLDLRQAELRLMLGGVSLRTIPYVEASVGSPRIAFRPGRDLPDWPLRVWRDGELVPARRRERVEITPPAPGAEAAPEVVVPPLPTDGPTPPSRYLVRFSGGYELEIRRQGARGALGLRDRLHLLATPGRARVRVRLTLAEDDATDLYRCLPPRVLLVVLGRPA